MTKHLSLTVLVSLFVMSSGFGQGQLSFGDTLPLGDKQVEDTTGRNITLQQTADNNGLIVIFSSNTCPWVAKWEDRMIEIATFASSNDFGMIALNANERIRDRGESLEDMNRRAQKQNYNFTYALDAGHEIADAFGAQYSPEVFVFDLNLQLVYHGAIDDNPNNASGVSNAYVMNALDALLSGETVDTRQSRIIGCSIKRSE
ncbi:redoxin family protein [Gracilimonas sp. Q87]|uniref:redoxin family protein n=1 Tax=Gracilimonas sp. Q87 TaxID=3384766 RepID=UPI0039841581